MRASWSSHDSPSQPFHRSTARIGCCLLRFSQIGGAWQGKPTGGEMSRRPAPTRLPAFGSNPSHPANHSETSQGVLSLRVAAFDSAGTCVRGGRDGDSMWRQPAQSHFVGANHARSNLRKVSRATVVDSLGSGASTPRPLPGACGCSAIPDDCRTRQSSTESQTWRSDNI
jgi:hypothetical protein